jgi:hypothetical protein
MTHIIQIREPKPGTLGNMNRSQIDGDVRGAKREDWLRVVIAARVASWDAAGR